MAHNQQPITQNHSASHWLATAGLFCFAAYWSVAVFPEPGVLLGHQDHGYQLAGAAEILAGSHPFIGFHDVYGPLTFYASAVGQWLSGRRVIGELILDTMAYAFAYALLFRLLMRGGVPLARSCAVTAAAVLLQTPSYKYYMVLPPVLFFWAADRYLAESKRTRLVLLAGITTIAGLFRPDMGVYLSITGAVLTGYYHHEPGRIAWRPAVEFLALVFAWAVPWLGWLLLNGGLMDYFESSSVVAVTTAIGMSRPLPAFGGGGIIGIGTLKALLYRIPYLLVALAAVILYARWPQLARQRRASLLAALVFSSVMLLQMSHLTGWIYICGTMPIVLLLLAWLFAAPASPTSTAPLTLARVLPGGFALLAVAALLAYSIYSTEWPMLHPRDVGEKLQAYSGSNVQMIDYVRAREPANATLRMLAKLEQFDRPDIPLMTVFGMPNLNYFSGRRLAGGQLAIYPGFYSNDRQLTHLIGRLREGDEALILLCNIEPLDKRPERVMEIFAPRFSEFLERETVQVGLIGRMKLLLLVNRPRLARDVGSPRS